MIYPSILDRKYQEYKPFVDEVSRKVKETLIKFSEEKGYAFTSRIKSIESLAEKIETGRFNKWSDLDDLFACTIIIPTLSHEEEVIQFCCQIFTLIPHKTVKRGQNKKPPETFRFDSTRIYAQLSKNDETDTGNGLSIYKIIFEIQIKSAFEHARSVATHDLVYKNSEIDWKKLRLAAQLKATVEQLDMLILAFEQTSEVIQDNNYTEIKVKRYLALEIKQLFETGKIREELKPKDISRFCDNLYRLLIQVSKETNIKGIIQQAIAKIKATKNNQIPLSISLFQYFISVLIADKIIETSLVNKYSWHITPEVTSLYPSLKTISPIFKYEDDV